jgi:hypothetical protein
MCRRNCHPDTSAGGHAPADVVTDDASLNLLTDLADGLIGMASPMA